MEMEMYTDTEMEGYALRTRVMLYYCFESMVYSSVQVFVLV